MNSATATLRLVDPRELMLSPIPMADGSMGLFVQHGGDSQCMLMDLSYAAALNKALTDHFAQLARQENLARARAIAETMK